MTTKQFSFDEAGRLTHVGHYIYKVLTAKGAEGWDTLSVGWDPWHEVRPVIRARVIEPDYSEHDLDPKAITEEPARGGDYKTYSDGKRLTAPLAGDCARSGGGGRIPGARDRAVLCAGPRGSRLFRT